MPSSLEIFANLFYLLSVLLAARNSVHTWAVGLVGCVLFGWLFFAEPLTMPTTIGTAIIITSCWVATRKRRVAIAPEVP